MAVRIFGNSRIRVEIRHALKRLKNRFRKSRALSFTGGGNAGKQVGGDRADGRTDHQPDGFVITQHSLLGKGLENDDGGGGTLQECRKSDTEQDAGDGIIQCRDEGNKRRRTGQGRDGALHHADAHKQHAKSQYHRADGLDEGLFDKQDDDTSHKQQEGCQRGQVKGGNLCGHRRSDIGAQDDTKSLGQRHETGIDETDQHHIGGT